MLGKDYYRIEVRAELSEERLRSLLFFYTPLVGSSATCIYQLLVLRGNSSSFEELNDLLVFLNVSIDYFQQQLQKLNECKLVKTLYHEEENRYIFVFNSPLLRNEFIQDDLLVRSFILKVSGEHYQRLLADDVFLSEEHPGYSDVSVKFNADILRDWSENDESYLKKTVDKTAYTFNSFFNINRFLKETSRNLFPMKYRTYENLSAIVTLADLYGISISTMKPIIQTTVKESSDTFNLERFKSECMKSYMSYRTNDKGSYNVPCAEFLMNLFDGKEVTHFEKGLLFELASDYHLNPSVINVLMEHCVKNCGGRIIKSYIYPIANDLHNHGIETPESALERLDRYASRNKTEESLPDYSKEDMPDIDEDDFNEFLKARKKK